MKSGLTKACVLGAIVTVGAPIGPALAQKHAHRQADAHVHGVAEISFIISGDELLVDLDTPLMNIVGFEHAPTTNLERRAAEAAIKLLNDPAKIAVPSPAAACVASKPAVVLPFDSEPAHTTTNENPTSATGDADRHAHEHMDVEASYAFTCKNIGRLEQIEVTALKTFPGIKTVHAIFLGPRAQTSRQLSASSPGFRLK